jgi:hypothetical protein
MRRVAEIAGANRAGGPQAKEVVADQIAQFWGAVDVLAHHALIPFRLTP